MKMDKFNAFEFLMSFSESIQKQNGYLCSSVNKYSLIGFDSLGNGFACRNESWRGEMPTAPNEGALNVASRLKH